MLRSRPERSAPLKRRRGEARSARARTPMAQLAIAEQVANGALEHDFIAGCPAGELEQPRQVVVRICGTVVEDERALVGCDRLGPPAAILDGDSEVEQVQRDAWVGADREPVAALGSCHRAGVMQQPAEVVVGIGQAWTAGQRALVGGDRAFRIAGFQSAACVVPAGRTGAAPEAAACPGAELEHARNTAWSEGQKITHVGNGIGTL